MTPRPRSLHRSPPHGASSGCGPAEGERSNPDGGGRQGEIIPPVIDVDLVRTRFPALATGTVFLDNPGGTQIARGALWRMERYLKSTNANHGGAFKASRESDATVAEGRAAAADFLNAPRPEEIVFGPNMTTLTLHLGRSLARTLVPGDEIVVTRLDHDANVAPWLLIAEDRGP